MRSRFTAGLFGPALLITVSSCGSGPTSFDSIDGIRDAIESSGYECDAPYRNGDGSDVVSCEDTIHGTWFPSASQAESFFETLTSMYEEIHEDHSLSVDVIRGDQWNIAGDEPAVTKVADSLNEPVVTLGN